MGPIQLDQGMAQWQVLWNAILNYTKDLPYTDVQLLLLTPPTLSLFTVRSLIRPAVLITRLQIVTCI